MNKDEPVPLIAKMSIQQKIAQLEARIVTLEQRQPIVYTKFTAGGVETKTGYVDPTAHKGDIWKSFDALIAKVFG